KHYKSIVFDRPNLKGHKFTYWSSNYGCLALILLPIFLIIGLLIRIGILGRTETIEIEAINKKTTPQQLSIRLADRLKLNDMLTNPFQRPVFNTMGNMMNFGWESS